MNESVANPATRTLANGLPARAPELAEPHPEALLEPSGLYRNQWWRWGLRLPHRVPRPVLEGLCRSGAQLYRLLQPAREGIVRDNLLPIAAGDRERAARWARATFTEFGRKLAALWRYEAGVSVADTVVAGPGWEHFEAVRSHPAGVLLVTLHLGNWELGAPLLVRQGVRPLVLTAPEPGAGLTELRQAARARHGVDTLVVGHDPFAFVGVIQRLQAGGLVALLLDRPPAGTGVSIDLLGQPFVASKAAAELARATGCAVLPVIVPREGTGSRWVAQALAPVSYDRRGLGQLSARREFTARILATFEPWLQRYPEQWFHFVPVWEGAGKTAEWAGRTTGPTAASEAPAP